MDIRQLRYFLAVCAEGNMSRAAQALHVTQPTLSRQIAELERELGCTLLVRGSRSVSLTEQGLYLRRRAEEIVDLADRTASELVQGEGPLEGDVRIGAGESEGMRVVAEAAQRFRGSHPHVRFHVRSGNGADVAGWLDQGLVDFAVLVSYRDAGRFARIRLAPADAWGVLMREDCALARRAAVSPADLAGLPVIASAQALESGELTAWFGDLADDVDVAATYTLVLNAAALVRAGVGYALALGGLAPTGAGSGLAFRPLDPPAASAIDFAWKPAAPLADAPRLFLDEMRHAAARP